MISYAKGTKMKHIIHGIICSGIVANILASCSPDFDVETFCDKVGQCDLYGAFGVSAGGECQSSAGDLDDGRGQCAIDAANCTEMKMCGKYGAQTCQEIESSFDKACGHIFPNGVFLGMTGCSTDVSFGLCLMWCQENFTDCNVAYSDCWGDGWCGFKPNTPAGCHENEDCGSGQSCVDHKCGGSGDGCKLSCSGSGESFSAGLSCGTGTQSCENSYDGMGELSSVSCTYSNGKSFTCFINYDGVGHATGTCSGEGETCSF